MNVFVTSKADKQRTAEIEESYPYRPPPYPANKKRHGPNTEVVCGVVIEDSRPQPTVETQSQCRGEFPRIYRTRDYSYCRGYFPKMEMTRRPLELSQAARDLIDALMDYYFHPIPAMERAAGKALARYEIWAKGIKISPPEQGGTEAASKERVDQRLSEVTRILGGNGTRQPAVVPGNNHGLKVIHTSLKQHEPIYPKAILDHVQSIFFENSIMVRRQTQRVGKYFEVREGGSGTGVIVYHKDRPDVYETIGYWTLISGGRHRWNLRKGYQDRLKLLYERLEIPTIEEVVDPLPV